MNLCFRDVALKPRMEESEVAVVTHGVDASSIIHFSITRIIFIMIIFFLIVINVVKSMLVVTDVTHHQEILTDEMC